MSYIIIYFSKSVSSVSLRHEPAPSVERAGLFGSALGLFHVHTSGHRYNLTPLKGKGAVLLLFRGKQHSGSSIGSRYRSRSAAHIVWEVIAQYQGNDGLPYVMLRNLSDSTWHKTMSQTELERGEQYSRVTEGFQSR
jgi:hypothetical protein